LNKQLIIITFAALLTVNTTQAQQQSAYYQVIELEGDDHLNVRAEPASASEDIGDLASGSKEWGRIIYLEGSGWVALRFMQQIEVEKLANTQVPVGLTCVGAKPFWTLEFKSQKIGVISTQEEVKQMAVVNTATSRNGNQFPIAVELQTAGNTATTTLRRAQCSDGMGGLRYEWAADLVVNPNFTLLSGCCSLR